MSDELSAEDLYPFRSWVRALAVRLASNEADARDLEQQVWTAAVERPPRERTNLRAWLATVARNAAHNLRRAASRREKHESLARPASPSQDPADLAAEAEAQRMLVGAVLELEQPYRNTVLLRWFEGLAPREVADRQGVPVATVYTRLARAHGLLRDGLDRTHGSRRAWVLLLVPAGAGLPVQPDAAQPAAVQPATSAAAGGSTAGATITGGTLMFATLTKTLGAAALVGILTLLAFWDGADEVNRAGDETAVGHELQQPRSPRVDYNRVPEVPETGAALADVDPESDLAGIVVDPSGAPVGGATLVVVDYPWAAAGASEESSALLPREGARTRSRDDGTFVVHLRRGDSVNLSVSAGGFASSEHTLRSAGERTRVVLQPAVRLGLVCARTDGAPVAGVPVIAVTWAPYEEPRVVRRGVSDDEGRLGWNDLPPGVKLHVHPAGWREAVEIVLPDQGGIERTLPFGLGRALTGRVLDAVSGEAIAGAQVDVDPLGEGTTTTAEDGTFALSDWRGAERSSLRCTAPGFASASVRPGDADEVTIALARGVHIRGRLVGKDGTAVAGAHVTATGIAESAGRPLSTARTVSDDDGRFDLPDISGEIAHRLVVAARGHAHTDRVLETSGKDVDLGDVVLGAPRAIAGRLVAGEAGVARVTIELLVAEADGALPSERVALRRTDHLGRFRFDDLAPGGYEVFSWGDGGPNSRRTVELEAEADVLDLVLGDASEEGLRMLVVRVVDDVGKPVADATVMGLTGTPVWATTGADGVARLEAPRTRLRVEARPPRGSRRHWLHAWPDSSKRVDAEATALTLTLFEGLPTTGTVRRANGSAQPGAMVAARTTTGGWINGWADRKGEFHLTLPRGDPVMLRWAGQILTPGHKIDETDEYAELTVAPGTTGVALQGRVVVRDQRIQVRVTLPDGGPAAGVEVLAHDLAVNDPRTVKATTDAAGRATLTGMASRPHRLGTSRMTVPDRVAPARWQEITPGETDEVLLELRETREISGTVTDVGGLPFKLPESGAPGHGQAHGHGHGHKLGPWARSSQSQSQSWSTSSGLESDGSFTILVPADDPGPYTVEFNLPPSGSGANRVRLGAAVEGVRPGDTSVRLIMAPRTRK